LSNPEENSPQRHLLTHDSTEDSLETTLINNLSDIKDRDHHNNINNINCKNKILNSSTGMVGIPEITEQGVKVRYLLDNVSRLGSGLQITSDVYPAVNGNYVIFKLGFEISNRDTPFYFIAEASRQRA
jgi:hypothetical protein